jgi:DNA-binding protein Fis
MSGTKGTLFDDVLGSVEAMVIGETFDQCDRVQTRTAALLGIDRNTLYKKLKAHQLLKSSGTTGPSSPASAAEPE